MAPAPTLAELTAPILRHQLAHLTFPDETLPGLLDIKICTNHAQGSEHPVLAAKLLVHATILYVKVKFPPCYPSVPPEVSIKGQVPHINRAAHSANPQGYYLLNSIWKCNTEVGWSNAYGPLQCLLHVQQFLSSFMTETDIEAMGGRTDLEDSQWDTYSDVSPDAAGAIDISAMVQPVIQQQQQPATCGPAASAAAKGEAAATANGSNDAEVDDGSWQVVSRGRKHSTKPSKAAKVQKFLVTQQAPVKPPAAQKAAPAASCANAAGVVGGSYPAAQQPATAMPKPAAAMCTAMYSALQPMEGLLSGMDKEVLLHAMGERVSPAAVNGEQEFRCCYTGLTFQQDLLCVPINFTVNPLKKTIDYILPCLDGYISMTAFEAGVQTTPSGEKFTHVLPLFINTEHYNRGASQRLAHTCKEIGAQRLDMFATLFNTCCVLLADGGIQALGRALAVIMQMFLLCNKACSEAGLHAEVDKHIEGFVHNPSQRLKHSTPSLGLFVALLVMVSRKSKYALVQSGQGRASVAAVLIMEAFVRNILWICKNRGEVIPLLKNGGSYTAEDAQLLSDASFEGGKTSMRVIGIFRVLESVILADGGSHASFVQGMEASLGVPSAVHFRRFSSGVRAVRAMSSWPQVLHMLNLKAMDSGGIARQLREAWKRSLRAGYHAADTNFAHIHRSGVSKVLLKGETYSGMGPGTHHIQVTDSWKWRTATTQFLDATLFAVGADGAVLDYIDFKKHDMYFKSQYTGKQASAAHHSGDVLSGQSGEHIMDIKLHAFPPAVTSLFVVVSAWHMNGRLEHISQPHVSIRDPAAGIEHCKYVLEDQPLAERQAKQAVVLCSFTRKGSAWDVNAIGRMCMGNAMDYSMIKACIKSIVNGSA